MANRVYRIPTPPSSLPITTQSTTLSGQTYRMDYRYNTRREVWELSLYDAQDIPVAEGKALVHGWDILRAVTTTNRPPGAIITYATSGQAPTLESLETDDLYYIVDEALDG